MRFSEALKIIDENVIIKHLPGKHNQKDHTPYKHRNAGWSEKHNLPYKPEYKGKGLASSWAGARKPIFDPHTAATVSVMAGTKKLPGKKELTFQTKGKLYEAAKEVGLVPKGKVVSYKGKPKDEIAQDLADHLKKHPEDAEKVQAKLTEAKEKQIKTPKEAIAETQDATDQAPKSASGTKTAAAVVAASSIPDDKPRAAVDTMPGADELTKVGSANYLGGAGDKYLYKDKDGNEYIFKPAEQKYGTGVVEPFRAHVQEAASQLGLMLHDNPLDVVEVKVITLDGKVGTLQKKLPIQGDLDGTTSYGKNVHKLAPEQLKQIQREHVVDYLLGNYDGHSGNFIQMRNGRLIGIDKEQSFRFMNDPKSKSMSYDYAPNHGTHEPIYNHLFRAYKNGKVDLDLNEVHNMVKRVEAIPDKKYKEMFRPYAESLHGKGAKAEKLLNQIVERKNGLRGEYEKFFSKLETERTGQPQTFKFKSTAKDAAAPTKQGLAGKKVVDLKAMAKDKGIKGYYNMTKEQLIAALSGGGAQKKLKLPKGLEEVDGVPAFQGKKLINNNQYIGSVVKGNSNTATAKHDASTWGKEMYTDISVAAKKLEQYANQAGVKLSKSEAKKMVSAVKEFTGTGSSAIRKAQEKATKGETLTSAQKAALSLGNKCDSLIELSPKWDGNGTLYRTIKVDMDNKAFWDQCKPGAIVSQLQGTSSWTSNINVWGGNVKFVLSGGTMMGASVKGISYHPGEDEILMHSKARHRIDKIEQKNGQTWVHVTEIPPITESDIPGGLIQKNMVYLTHVNESGGDIMKEDKEKDKVEVRDRLPDEGFSIFNEDTGEWIDSENDENE